MKWGNLENPHGSRLHPDGTGTRLLTLTVRTFASRNATEGFAMVEYIAFGFAVLFFCGLKFPATMEKIASLDFFS
jgi:hypothetical protein